MDGPSPGLLFFSRFAHMEENQRSTDMAMEKGKSNTTEAGEDEKVDITCVEGEAGRAH